MTEIKVGDVLCEGTEEKTYSVVVTAGRDRDGFQFSTVNVDGNEDAVGDGSCDDVAGWPIHQAQCESTEVVYI
jgi:hypothetical protein